MTTHILRPFAVTVLSLAGLGLMGWLGWTTYHIATGMALYHFWLLAAVGAFIWLALVYSIADEITHHNRAHRHKLVVSVSGDAAVHRPLSFSFPSGLRHKKTLTAGRSTNCCIRLGNPAVSNRHLSLTLLRRGEILIEDLASTNGTLVQGERLEARKSVFLHPPVQLGLPGEITLNLLVEDFDEQ